MEFYESGGNYTDTLKLVSIPNGMEFYVSLSKTSGAAQSFNSQRDGILLFQEVFIRWGYVVSIPNGMEFYAFDGALEVMLAKFQFPTGWNSTILLLSF